MLDTLEKHRAVRSSLDGFSLPALTGSVFIPASRRCTITINPKAACSTLKLAIWKQEFALGATRWAPPRGGIHRKQRTPFKRASTEDLEEALFDRPVFSIVRNPYTRLLAAYLDKIAVKIKRPKRQLLVQMGRTADGPVMFAEFVEFICSQSSRQLNQHYAPQSFLMQVHYHPYAYIGCVEEMEASLATITSMAYGVETELFQDFRPHRTEASARIAKYFTDEIAEMVLERYRADFDDFGYDYDLGKALLPPTRLREAAQIGRARSETTLRPAIRSAVAAHRRNHAAALELLPATEPDDPELDYTRARLLSKLRRNDEALAIMQRVVERVDNVGSYWLLLAKSLRALNRRTESDRAAERAVIVSPIALHIRRAIWIWQVNDFWDMLESFAARMVGPLRRVRDGADAAMAAKRNEEERARRREWRAGKIAIYKERVVLAEALGTREWPRWSLKRVLSLSFWRRR